MSTKRAMMLLACALTLVFGAAFQGEAGVAIGANGVSGCTTILPVFPTPVGAAPACGAPTGATAVPLPTDGITQWLATGVDDANNAYVLHADGATGPLAGLSASVPSYSEPCVAGEPSAIGLASGVISVTVPAASTLHVGFPGDSAVVSADYAWVRVGLNAIVRLGVAAGGGGVVDFAIGPDVTGLVVGVLPAVLVPIPPLGTCAAPLPLEVHVLGAGGLAV